MAATLKRIPHPSLLFSRYFSSPIIHHTTRSLQTLAYEELRRSPSQAHTSTAFILHGLLGSGRNWRSFARSLALMLSQSSPSSNWRMILVDLRNHGRSAELKELPPPHDLINAAKDLADLVEHQGWDWPDVVIGHSLGGKIALQYAEDCAKGVYGHSAVLPKQLWVLDSDPGKVSRGDSSGEVEKVLEILQKLPSPIPSRKWLVDHMLELGFSKTLSQWLGSNLNKQGEQETWAFNLKGAVEMFNSYRDRVYWHLLEHPPKGTEIALMRAEKSDRWEPQVIQRLEGFAAQCREQSEGKFSVHVLPNSGHWVHVDNPKGVLEIVAPKIVSLAS